jgi:hypothetical protein
MRAPAVLALLLAASTLPRQRRPADLAIRDVRVVHGDGRVAPAATILVRSGRIVAWTSRPGAIANRRAAASTGAASRRCRD